MTDIRIERDFKVSPARLFKAITQTEEVMAWFGPETISVGEGQVDFTAKGPWYAILVGEDGARYKVSGQITHVDPPRSVGYTWGWHDDDDQRGPESFVTLTVSESATGTRLIIDHRDLADEDIAASHEHGWTSTLQSLATLLEN